MNENSEKELLKQDLNNQENPEEIKKFIEDVELMGENEDIVEMAKQKLEEILAKANTVEKTSESQISQVESMNGSVSEIEKRTEGIDKQIEEVKTEAVEKIEEVKNQENQTIEKQEVNQQKTENSEKSKEEIEKEKLLKEFSEKAEEFRQKGKQEYENFISGRISDYKELVVEVKQFIQQVEEGDLDKMLKSVGYLKGSFDDLNSRAVNHVRPYKNNVRHPQIQAIEGKINSEYERNYDVLKMVAKGKDIELPIKKPLLDTEDKLFYELIDIDKQNGQLLDSLSQKGKEMDEKIREKANEFMNSQMEALNKLEQEYKNMPEQQELVNLNGQLKTLEDKKTGVFFSEKKKDEQLKELRDKIYETDRVIKNFVGNKKNKIADILHEFKDKFKFANGLLSEDKYGSVWVKLNSI